jgi:hypothetical protein
MTKNEKISWPQVSKIVGWDKRTVEYPTMEEVNRFREIASRGELSGIVELLRYYRFLKSPENNEQLHIINKVSNAVTEFREKYCD